MENGDQLSPPSPHPSYNLSNLYYGIELGLVIFVVIVKLITDCLLGNQHEDGMHAIWARKGHLTGLPEPSFDAFSEPFFPQHCMVPVHGVRKKATVFVLPWLVYHFFLFFVALAIAVVILVFVTPMAFKAYATIPVVGLVLIVIAWKMVKEPASLHPTQIRRSNSRLEFLFQVLAYYKLCLRQRKIRQAFEEAYKSSSWSSSSSNSHQQRSLPLPNSLGWFKHPDYNGLPEIPNPDYHAE